MLLAVLGSQDREESPRRKLNNARDRSGPRSPRAPRDSKCRDVLRGSDRRGRRRVGARRLPTPRDAPEGRRSVLVRSGKRAGRGSKFSRESLIVTSEKKRDKAYGYAYGYAYGWDYGHDYGDPDWGHVTGVMSNPETRAEVFVAARPQDVDSPSRASGGGRRRGDASRGGGTRGGGGRGARRAASRFPRRPPRPRSPLSPCRPCPLPPRRGPRRRHRGHPRRAR